MKLSVNSVNKTMPANTITMLLASATQQLAAAGCDTPRLDAEVLLAHMLDKDRTWLYRYPEKQIEPSQQRAYAGLITRREKHEPVAYLVGHKEFFGLDFRVNNYVLIPRPETELLVETAIYIVKNGTAKSKTCTERPTQCVGSRSIQNLKPVLSAQRNALAAEVSKIVIADVGTGSGCIAVSLAKHLPQATVFAIDISQQALEIARQNAIRHQVSSQITFLWGNLLEPLNVPVDIIVSNPPYVNPQALAAPFTTPEVHQFEPRPALNGGRDGLEVIKRLLPEAKEKLNVGGSLLVEIGSDQGQTIKSLAQAQFPDAEVQIKKDLAHLDRLLVVQT